MPDKLGLCTVQVRESGCVSFDARGEGVCFGGGENDKKCADRCRPPFHCYRGGGFLVNPWILPPFHTPHLDQAKRGFRGEGRHKGLFRRPKKIKLERNLNNFQHQRNATRRLSAEYCLIKEPGSNPDHTALPNSLVSSTSVAFVSLCGAG